MKASSRTVSLLILLGAVIGFFVGVAYRGARTAARARGVLDAVRRLDASGNGTQQMQAIQQQYGLDKRCEQTSCVYYALFQNPITMRRLRAPTVEMSISVRVEQDRLALATVTFSNTDVHRGTSSSVAIRELFAASAGEQHYRVHQLAGESGRGVQANIAFTSNADAIRNAAFDLNTRCLARLRGCTANELAPKAFALKSTE